jgi:putative transposase
MNEDSSIIRLRQPDVIDDPLTVLLRSGARQLLEQTIEAEVEAFLASKRDLRLADGRDRLVRHGHGPERVVQTGIGPVEVHRVKIRDQAPGPAAERIRFSSALLPRWARRTTSSALSSLRATTPCCRSCTCAASRPVISRRR